MRSTPCHPLRQSRPYYYYHMMWLSLSPRLSRRSTVAIPCNLIFTFTYAAVNYTNPTSLHGTTIIRNTNNVQETMMAKVLIICHSRVDILLVTLLNRSCGHTSFNRHATHRANPLAYAGDCTTPCPKRATVNLLLRTMRDDHYGYYCPVTALQILWATNSLRYTNHNLNSTMSKLHLHLDVSRSGTTVLQTQKCITSGPAHL